MCRPTYCRCVRLKSLKALALLQLMWGWELENTFFKRLYHSFPANMEAWRQVPLNHSLPCTWGHIHIVPSHPLTTLHPVGCNAEHYCPSLYLQCSDQVDLYAYICVLQNRHRRIRAPNLRDFWLLHLNIGSQNKHFVEIISWFSHTISKEIIIE